MLQKAVLQGYLHVSKTNEEPTSSTRTPKRANERQASHCLGQATAFEKEKPNCHHENSCPSEWQPTFLQVNLITRPDSVEAGFHCLLQTNTQRSVTLACTTVPASFVSNERIIAA